MVTEEQVWEALQEVQDPEMPISIVDLGLIYDVQVQEDHVSVKMTLTVPGCPMHQTISQEARDRLLQIPGVKEADVAIVWDPKWNPDMVTPEGRAILGLESK